MCTHTHYTQCNPLPTAIFTIPDTVAMLWTDDITELHQLIALIRAELQHYTILHNVSTAITYWSNILDYKIYHQLSGKITASVHHM